MANMHGLMGLPIIKKKLKDNHRKANLRRTGFAEMKSRALLGAFAV
jgi:hypothetical protein